MALIVLGVGGVLGVLGIPSEGLEKEFGKPWKLLQEAKEAWTPSQETETHMSRILKMFFGASKATKVCDGTVSNDTV